MFFAYAHTLKLLQLVTAAAAAAPVPPLLFHPATSVLFFLLNDRK